MRHESWVMGQKIGWLTGIFLFIASSSVQGLDPASDGLASPFSVEESTAPLREWPTPFAKELSRRLDWPLEKLERLEKRGFGRTEMVSFVAIAQKSSKTWDELVKQREKGATLRSMAEEAGLTYNDVFRNSQKIKSEIDEKTIPLETKRNKTFPQETAVPEKSAESLTK